MPHYIGPTSGKNLKNAHLWVGQWVHTLHACNLNYWLHVYTCTCKCDHMYMYMYTCMHVACFLTCIRSKLCIVNVDYHTTLYVWWYTISQKKSGESIWVVHTTAPKCTGEFLCHSHDINVEVSQISVENICSRFPWVYLMLAISKVVRYRRAGIFHGRKLSQIGGKMDFADKTFVDYLLALLYCLPSDLTFAEKTSLIGTKQLYSWKISPSKALSYTVVAEL